MTFSERIRLEFSGPSLPLAALGAAINLTAGQITAALKIPIYLDSVGTVLVAVLSGPFVAAVSGSAANLLAAAFGNPSMVFFIPVVVVIAFVTAFVARLGAFRRLWTVVGAGALQGVVAAVVAAPIAAYVFGGTMLAGTDFLVMLYRSWGNDILRSTLLQGLTSDPIDKAISYAAVYLLIRRMPERLVARFPGASHLLPPSPPVS